MKKYLEFYDISYDTIDEFIEAAVQQEGAERLFLLGKASSYAEVAFALDIITKADALAFLDRIDRYAGRNTN